MLTTYYAWRDHKPLQFYYIAEEAATNSDTEII